MSSKCNSNTMSPVFFIEKKKKRKKKYYMPTFCFAALPCAASLPRNWLHPELIISNDGHKSETYAEWSVQAPAGHLLSISPTRVLIHLIFSPLPSIPLSLPLFYYYLPLEFIVVFIWKQIGARVKKLAGLLGNKMLNSQQICISVSGIRLWEFHWKWFKWWVKK